MHIFQAFSLFRIILVSFWISIMKEAEKKNHHLFWKLQNGSIQTGKKFIFQLSWNNTRCWNGLKLVAFCSLLKVYRAYKHFTRKFSPHLIRHAVSFCASSNTWAISFTCVHWIYLNLLNIQDEWEELIFSSHSEIAWFWGDYLSLLISFISSFFWRFFSCFESKITSISIDLYSKLFSPLDFGNFGPKCILAEYVKYTCTSTIRKCV